MKSIFDTVNKILLKNKELKSEDGKLLKNKAVELAHKLDEELIKLLLENSETKKQFFKDVAKITIFNIEEFVKFVSNKEFLPDSYTVFSQNVGLMIGDEYLKANKDVILAWPYKDCVLEGGMTKEDQKRDEVFYNKTLAPDKIDRLLDPKAFTNFSRIDKKGEHKLDGFKRDEKGNIKDNLIIKGNNLLALASLKKEFAGKVKLIYIDPPYNREVDGFYNDNFKHSSWLTFMKNRIEIACEMLRDDGVIFVQCDDNEYPYLKVLMDEIYGLKYELTYYVQVRYAQKTLAENSNYQKLIEHVLCYSKQSFKPIKLKANYDIDKFCWRITELKKGKIVEMGGKRVEVFKPGEFKIEEVDSSSRGLKEVWATGTLLRTTAKFFRDYIIDRKSIDGLGVLYKVPGVGEDGLGYRYFTGPQRATATKGKYYSGIPTDVAEALSNGNATKELVINNFYDMSDAFGNCRHEGGVELRSGKKPEIWLKTLLDIGSKKGDIVMDFFMGTGGTCAVSHKSKRQYIGIEQLDYGKDSGVVRLKNVIDGDQTGISEMEDWKSGGDFIHMELAKWNEEWMEKIKKAKNAKELAKLWNEMKETAFLSYKVEPRTIDANAKDFADLSIIDQKKFLIECLDKNQLYINYSEIEDKEYGVSKEDTKLNKEFYGK